MSTAPKTRTKKVRLPDAGILPTSPRKRPDIMTVQAPEHKEALNPSAAETKAQQAAGERTATVTTFKASGKYNTVHAWRVPVDAIGPYDMKHSPDFNLPAGWTALVDADAASELFPGSVNWGFPCLLRAEGQ